jgi:transposase
VNIVTWVDEWLAGERAAGKKCLEVKKINNSYYVYHSTSRYDKATKKAKKVSTYLGKLDPEKGLIKSQSKTDPKVKSIHQYGNALFLHHALAELLPLLEECFEEDWKEIYALATVRAMGYTPLKRVASVWERLADINQLQPKLGAKYLGQVLKRLGSDAHGQLQLFNRLTLNGKELVYDLSCFFTRSDEINLAEKGYNKDGLQLQQINLALLCSAETGLPSMIRAIPGSVKDVSTLITSLEEIGLTNKTLILDRGFFSDNIIEYLVSRQISYVVPTRRNSKLYDVRIHLKQHFFYRDRLIKCGRRKHNDLILYLYEDSLLRLEEEKRLYKKLTEGHISKTELDVEIRKAGRILLISNIEDGLEELYLLNKKRDRVEKLFDSYKTTLNADRSYLQDDESIFGHVFIAFLSLYAYSRMEQIIKHAGLTSKYSVADVLEEFSKVYVLESGGKRIVTEIPKKVKVLEEKLALNIFPK